MTMLKTAVNDRPLHTEANDSLENNRYALGLYQFVSSSDTPITIGIQGGWGSGKTSLMNLLETALDESGTALCININAWEHSLFHSESKGNVALSVLQEMVSTVSKVVNDHPTTINKEIRDQLMKGGIAEKFKKLGKFIVGTAYIGANVATHGALGHIAENMPESDIKEQASPAEAIRALRSEIASQVQLVVEKSTYKRFVFFVDDLDRVPPQTAIEILDVLKNIFDVENCVFLLAVDFDVVVKGLAGKFGARNDANDREFRQYFDKIIQVPFSMPVGAYRSNIERLMDSLVSNMTFGAALKANMADLAEIAWLATDGVPRSIKRIINTMSLLILIKKIGEQGNPTSSGSTDEVTEADRLFILFAVVTIQINFAFLYEKLIANPDFVSWTIDGLDKQWDLQAGDLNIEALSQQAELEEGWESVVYLLCKKHAWALRKAIDVIHILKLLKHKLLSMDQREISFKTGATPSLPVLEDVLEAVAVTSVDSKPSQTEKGSVRNDMVTQFAWRVHAALAEANSEAIAPCQPERRWAKQTAGAREYYIDVRSEYVSQIALCFYRDKSNRSLYTIKAMAQLVVPARDKKRFRAHIDDARGLLVEGSDWYSVEVSGGAYLMQDATDTAREACVNALQDVLRKVVNRARQFA